MDLLYLFRKYRHSPEFILLNLGESYDQFYRQTILQDKKGMVAFRFGSDRQE
jgi:hypothetical protein